jgi:hypothetical protein
VEVGIRQKLCHHSFNRAVQNVSEQITKKQASFVVVVIMLKSKLRKNRQVLLSLLASFVVIMFKSKLRKDKQVLLTPLLFL